MSLINPMSLVLPMTKELQPMTKILSALRVRRGLSRSVACRALAAVAVAVPALACDGGSDAPRGRAPGSVEYGARDSAGVIVVENAKPAEGSRLGWTMSSAPLVSIGTAEGEGEWQLYRVRDATRLADGRIVVANRGSTELLVFDEAGLHVASWGGEGEGPGEFVELDRVAAWSGDSIVASDSYQKRVSFFDGDGVHGRTSVLPGEVTGLLRRVMGAVRGDQPTHVLLDVVSDSLLLTWSPSGVLSGFQQMDHVFEIKDADGGLLASLGEYPGQQTYTATVQQEENFMLFVPLRHPFGQTTEWAAWGDLVAFGRTETYEIRAFRTDGSLARIVRRDHEPSMATRADLDARLEEVILRQGAELQEGLREIIADVPMVEGVPAFGSVRGDALGYLWVAEFRSPGVDPSQTVWTIFSPEGVVQGFVETPGDLEVYEIGPDYVLGRVRDELGTEYVRAWGLERR